MIDGLQQANISLNKGIVRTPSLGQEGELSECVNLIPRNGEMVRMAEPQPYMVGSMHKALYYTFFIERDEENALQRLTMVRAEKGYEKEYTFSFYTGHPLYSAKKLFKVKFRRDETVASTEWVEDKYTEHFIEEQDALLLPYKPFSFSVGQEVSFPDVMPFEWLYSYVKVPVSEEQQIYDLLIYPQMPLPGKLEFKVSYKDAGGGRQEVTVELKEGQRRFYVGVKAAEFIDITLTGEVWPLYKKATPYRLFEFNTPEEVEFPPLEEQTVVSITDDFEPLVLREGEELMEIHEMETCSTYITSREGVLQYFISNGNWRSTVYKLSEAPAGTKILAMGNVLIVYGQSIRTKWFLFKDNGYKEQQLAESGMDVNFRLDSEAYTSASSEIYVLPSERVVKSRKLVLTHTMSAAKNYETINYPFQAGKWYSITYEPRIGGASHVPSKDPWYSKAIVFSIGVRYNDDTYASLYARGKQGDSDKNHIYRSAYHERVFCLDKPAKSVEISAWYSLHEGITWETGLVDPGYTVSQGNLYGRFRVYEVTVATREGGGYYVIPDETATNFNSLMGSINAHATTVKDSYKQFMHPFFIRYGLKLQTGEVYWVSAPILMEPNDKPPVVLIGGLTYRNNDTLYSPYYGGTTVGFWRSTIKYRVDVDPDLIAILSEAGLEISLVIAIAPPLYVYNQSANAEDFYASGVQASVEGGAEAPYTYSFSGVREFPLPSYSYFIRIPVPSPDYTGQIGEVNPAMFNIVSTLSLGSIKAGEWVPLDLTTEKMNGVYGNSLEKLGEPSTPMKDVGHSSFSTAFEYNRRLTVANIVQYGFRGYSPGCMSGWTSNGLTKEASYNVSLASEGKTPAFEAAHKALRGGPPGWRFFFYPSTRAKRATLYLGNEKAELTLTKCDFMDGAYFFAPQFTYTNEEGATEDKAPVLSGSNKVMLSYSDNPFAWQKEYYLPCNKILAISSITKALSQGQFGEFPLLAFCDNGVWALSINPDGTFDAKQPLSRDILSNREGLLQLDDGIVFPSEKGLMLLRGSDITNISDTIAGHNFDETWIGEETDIEDFRGEIKDALMVYDYAHQEVHVFPKTPKETKEGIKHYVYSLESRNWVCQALPKEGGGIKAIIHSYPFSVLQFDEQLKQYTNDPEIHSPRDGWLLTRPIAFGDPFIRKMLWDLRVMGQKTHQGTNWSVQVYISEDRIKWHRLKSLKGRSAKWYRFLIKASMTGLDTLSGITCQYVPRLGGKLR